MEDDGRPQMDGAGPAKKRRVDDDTASAALRSPDSSQEEGETEFEDLGFLSFSGSSTKADEAVRVCSTHVKACE